MVRLSLDSPELSLYELSTLLGRYGEVRCGGRIGRLYVIEAEAGDEGFREAAARSSSLKLAARLEVVSANVEEFVREARRVAGEVGRPYLVREVYGGAEAERLADEVAAALEGVIAGPAWSAPRGAPKLLVAVDARSGLMAAGRVVAEAPRRRFVDREPSRRPCFSPSTLHPKLALAMLNLSGASRGSVVLDPFCGVGGILIEAARLGIENIGIDIEWKWLAGARRNVEWVDPHMSCTHLILGDGCNPPLRAVDHVVTDPPYGRITTTASRGSEAVYREFLESCRRLVRPGGRVVFMSPHYLSGEVGAILRKLGTFREDARFILPVHRSLTRILYVICKLDPRRRGATPRDLSTGKLGFDGKTI